jgi:hypothetical protein
MKSMVQFTENAVVDKSGSALLFGSLIFRTSRLGNFEFLALRAELSYLDALNMS